MKQEKENSALVPALLCKMLDRHYPSSLPFFPFLFIYSFFFGDPAESVQLASVSGSLTYRSLLVKPLGIKKKQKVHGKPMHFLCPFCSTNGTLFFFSVLPYNRRVLDPVILVIVPWIACFTTLADT